MGELNVGACNEIYKFKPFRYTYLSSLPTRPMELEEMEDEENDDNEYSYKIHPMPNSKNIYLCYTIMWGYPDYDFETQILKFNFATRKWTNDYINGCPLDYFDRVLVLDNDVLMAYISSKKNNGGYELFIRRFDSKHICYPGLPFMAEGPPLLYNPVVVCHGGYVYVIGRISGYDVHRIKLETSSETSVWEIMYEGNGQHEHGRSSYKIACAEESLVMLGSNGGWVDFREISIFNIEMKKWTKINTVGDYGITDNGGYLARQRSADREALCDYQSYRDTKLELHFIFSSRNTIAEIWKIDLEMFQWIRINIVLLPPFGIAATRDRNRNEFSFRFGCVSVFAS